MNKHIVVFCEGANDIAFLSRILYVYGFKPHKKKIKDFSKPFNTSFIKSIEKKKIEDTEFKFQRPNKEIPYVILEKDDVMIIFHNFDGDGNFTSGGADSIIQMYLDLNVEDIRKIERYDKLNYRFLLFLDADSVGVQDRLIELGEILEVQNLQSHSICKINDDYEIGCYIFHDENDKNKFGQLEDILLSLMSESNTDKFNNSKSFLKKNVLKNERTKKYTCNNIEEKYSGSSQFKEKKSIISIAGQLQFSGSNNSVIIANSDYITKDKIANNPHCKDILKLFQCYSNKKILI